MEKPVLIVKPVGQNRVASDFFHVTFYIGLGFSQHGGLEVVTSSYM